LAYGNRHPTYSAFGGLRYDEIFSDLVTLFTEENVKLLPYEYLRNDPVKFLDEIAKFMDIEHGSLNDCAGKPAVNANQNQEGQNILREMNTLGRLFSSVDSLRRVHWEAISKRIPSIMLNPLKKFYIGCANSADSWKSAGVIQLDDSAKMIINEMYKDGNRRFMNISGIDVAELGYPL